MMSSVVANAGVVTGSVTDSIASEPLIGASIIVKDKNYGAVTDIDGNYKMTVPDGKYSLIVRYVGYKDEILPDFNVKGEVSGVDILLSPDNNTLAEVTVTARVRHDSETAQIREH